MDNHSIHGMWSSRLAFILAASGSAVGLGNIWRFPYLASDNGGGAFVLIYLACIVLVGLPIMAAEILMGRQGRMSPVNTLRKLTREGGHSGGWTVIGWIGMVSAVLILSFYSVVGGWTMHYTWLYIAQLFGARRSPTPRPRSPPCSPAPARWCSGTPPSCWSRWPWWRWAWKRASNAR